MPINQLLMYTSACQGSGSQDLRDQSRFSAVRGVHVMPLAQPLLCMLTQMVRIWTMGSLIQSPDAAWCAYNAVQHALALHAAAPDEAPLTLAGS